MTPRDVADDVVELLIGLIRNGCVNDGSPDSGHERRSVETLTDFLGQRGTEYEPHPGRVSTLYRVPGSDPDAPSLMLMGHTDVVPVSIDGWSRDPFGGDLHDGFVWGRGAVDMLDQTAAMAAAFRPYLVGDIPPPTGDLMFLAVADEEAGGRLGARWLVEEHWDAVGCDYLLTEIGAPPLPGRDGDGIPVTVAEKGPQWRRMVAAGTPGHGSQPYAADNAALVLADAVHRLGSFPPEAVITDEWIRFVKEWGPGDDLEQALTDPDRIDGAVERIAGDDLGLARWIHACTRLTVSPNTLDAGVKVNVIPDSGVAEVDTRALPGQTEEDVLEHFRIALGPAFEAVDIETVQATAAAGSEPAGILWDALDRARSEIAPGTHLVPAMIPVGTDARFFRPRGTVAYGVGLFDDRVSFGDFLRMFHGHDERVTAESVRLTTDLLSRTIAHFSESSAAR